MLTIVVDLLLWNDFEVMINKKREFKTFIEFYYFKLFIHFDLWITNEFASVISKSFVNECEIIKTHWEFIHMHLN